MERRFGISRGQKLRWYVMIILAIGVIVASYIFRFIEPDIGTASNAAQYELVSMMLPNDNGGHQADYYIPDHGTYLLYPSKRAADFDGYMHFYRHDASNNRVYVGTLDFVTHWTCLNKRCTLFSQHTTLKNTRSMFYIMMFGAFKIGGPGSPHGGTDKSDCNMIEHTQVHAHTKVASEVCRKSDTDYNFHNMVTIFRFKTIRYPMSFWYCWIYSPVMERHGSTYHFMGWNKIAGDNGPSDNQGHAYCTDSAEPDGGEK